MLPLHTILFPTDFSSCAEHAFPHAAAPARQHGTTLHVLHVINPVEGDAYSPVRYSPEASARHENLTKLLSDLLAGVGAGLEAEGVRLDRVKLHAISVAPKILAYAQEVQADLIVMGTHGRRGVQRMVMGSVAEEVVRQAPCPVFTVREGTPPAAGLPQRLLIPMDLSAPSREALAYAKDLADQSQAQLHLLHVIEPLSFPAAASGLATLNDLLPELRRQSLDEMRQLLSDVEVSATLHVEHGSAVPTILDFATLHQVDLIVMATHGLTGLGRFLLGSVAERIVRSAACPVVVVKPHVVRTDAPGVKQRKEVVEAAPAP